MQVKAQLAHNMIDSRNVESNNQWQVNFSGAPSYSNFPNFAMNLNSHSQSSSLESMDQNNSSDGVGGMQEIQSCRDEFAYQMPAASAKKRAVSLNELGELQELALRMMRN